MVQACENQKASIEAAKSLMEGFDAFSRVENHTQELRDRPQTRAAVLSVLEVIRKACEYVRDNTKDGYSGERHLMEMVAMSAITDVYSLQAICS